MKNWKIKISQRAGEDTSPPPPLSIPDNSTAIAPHTVGGARRVSTVGASTTHDVTRIVSMLRCAARAVVSLTRAAETLRLVMDYGRSHTTGSTSASAAAIPRDPASIHARTLLSPPPLSSSRSRSRSRTLAIAHRYFARASDRRRTHTCAHTH